MFTFTNSVALITGGSRGIGRAVARAFTSAGGTVAINYHQDHEAAESAVGDIVANGGRAQAWSADVANRSAVRDMVAAIRDTFGRIDYVVTSAGIWSANRLVEFNEERFESTLRTNIHGTLWPILEAQSALAAARGAIVTIGSTAGQRGEDDYSPYALSKGGVHALTKSLAVELAPEIRVNCVAPGWVRTDMTDDALTGERVSRALRGIPLGRIAEPEDLAGPILFLLSEHARHITGEILNVNGGSVLCG